MTEPLLYDRERTALRDLLHLLEDRARREADLEARLQAELQAAERDAAQARQKIADGREREADAVEAAFRQAEEAIARRAADDLVAADRAFNETSLRITDQFEEAEEKANTQFQEARWTLSSHTEAEEKRAQEQLQSLKGKAAAGAQQAEALRQAADPLLARVGLAVEDLAPPAPAEPPAGLDTDALAERLQGAIAGADALLLRLQGMRLLELFRTRGVVGLFLACWAAVAVPGALVTPDVWLLWVPGGAVAAVALTAGIWVGLRALARRRADRLGSDLAAALAGIGRDGQRLAEQAEAAYRQQQADLHRRHKREQRRVENKFQPLLDQLEERRAFAADEAARRQQADSEAVRHRRDQARRRAEHQRQRDLAASAERHDRAEREAQVAYADRITAARAAYDDGWAKLADDWRQGLTRAGDVFSFLRAEADRLFPDWDSPAWQDPDRPAPAGVPRGLRFGTLDVDLTKLPGGVSPDPRLPTPEEVRRLALPAYLPFPERCGLVLKARDAGRARAVGALQATMLRFLTALPPGKVRFTVIDPVGLGENFASFMHLADYDEQLVAGRIWTEPHQIEGRLADLTAHMENVIQKYLRNQYKSIEEYNEQAGEVAEAYRVLVVANFPVNFSADAARRLVSILGSGPGCGVYGLVSVDTRQPLPTGFQLADLEQAATLVLANAEGDRFTWPDDTFRRFPLALEAAPEPARVAEVVHTVGYRAKHAQRVEVPFDFIAPPPEKVWAADSRRGIDVPLGRSGATKRQSLQLGRGTAQHALVAGKTGSGKSTLLHALITNLALHYGPDEVELFLIDFKKGVEFKAYATQQLPHARVIAIESEREFGLSVLQRLDAELKIRGDRFRAAGVHDVAGYRDAHPDAVCPRILLIVDEFQEFFVEDDKLAQEAALLLDRLVRQGRAFGLHVLLGSQTLGGAYSLARSTIDQMAVRIALQCSEADAQLILSKDNAAARLLSRPGEAIYNDANGRLEGNDLFQVVWLSDGQRVDILHDLHERAAGRPAQPPLVFEGNVPAELGKNPQLDRLLQAPEWPAAPPRSSTAWLGDAVAIKDATAAVFRPQGGLNLLMIGQHDEAALAMLTGAVIALSAQHPPAEDGNAGLRFAVLDGTPPEDPLAGYWAKVADGLPHPLTVAAGRDVRDVLAPLADEVKQRHEGGSADRTPRFLIVHGLHRFRDLRKAEDEYSFGRRGGERVVTPAELFATLLRDGPAVGVHCLVWCDSLTNLTRAIDRQGLRECELRVLFQMSAADSSHLIDSPLATRLGRNRALFHREDQGQPEKFRPYGLPSEEWLAWAKGRLRAKAAPLGLYSANQIWGTESGPRPTAKGGAGDGTTRCPRPDRARTRGDARLLAARRGHRRRGPRPPRRRGARPHLPHGRQPRPAAGGEGVPPPGEPRPAVPLPTGPVVRGRLRAAARRPGAARLPRLAGATAGAAARGTEADGPGAGRPGSGLEGAGPMNELGIALVWAAVQTTVVAAAGLALCALAARRGPGAGSAAATAALAAAVVLAVLAWCPLPAWWSWETVPAAADAGPASAPAFPTPAAGGGEPAPPAAEPTDPPARGGVGLSGLSAAVRLLSRGRGAMTADSPGRSWPVAVAAVVLTGSAVALARLLLGLWAVGVCRRRSRPVDDPGLLAEVEGLRAALGCRRPVTVREAADLATAATAGWRRPVVLLPTDWREWTAAQRRAVLAHELAHAGRGDYAAWLLARVGVALHWFHPLVRRLAARLHLHQELAADALAARLAGGRGVYLKALASLALRAEGRPVVWAAPTFLSPPGTLLRRIAMLRVTDDTPGRTVPHRRPWLAAALVVAIAAAVSALRGPTREALAGPPAERPKPEEVAPFDLSLLRTDDKEADGFYGVRPAALLNRPGAEPTRKAINAEIDAVMAALLQGNSLGIHAEDVEQIMGRVYFKGENKAGKRSMVMSLNALRTTRDMDWAKLRDACGGLLKRREWKGETYVGIEMSELLMSLLGKGDGYLWAADARTLVFENEDHIKALIEAKAAGKKLPTPDYAAGWDGVSRGLIAVAIDNRNRRLLDRTVTEAELKECLADPNRPDYHFIRFYQNAGVVVAGVGGADDCRVDVRASADNPAAAAELVRTCELVLAASKNVLTGAEKEAALGGVDAVIIDFERKLLDRAAVHRDGTVVTVHAEVASGLNAFISRCMKGMNSGDE
jgi:hypothetical protein